MSILPIFIPHAGCPQQCVFCNQKTISGQKKPALEGAIEQINTWLKWFKPGQEQEAAFYGGSFTALDISLQKQLLQLTDQLINQGVIGKVRLSTRPDAITAEGLELLKQHQVYLVELGVQSLDDEVLALAERGHKAEAVYKAMVLLKSAGFQTGIQLMVGMPGQSFASIKATVDQVIKLKPDIARIYPLLVIKGTPLAQQLELGSFSPLCIEEAVEQATYVYRKLTEVGIKVIRIGLQADEELCSPGNILAGPFHPSMGELVKSRALRQQLEETLETFVAGSREFHEPQIFTSESGNISMLQSFYLQTLEGGTIEVNLEKLSKGTYRLDLKCDSRLHSKIVGMKKENLQYFAAKGIEVVVKKN